MILSVQAPSYALAKSPAMKGARLRLFFSLYHAISSPTLPAYEKSGKIESHSHAVPRHSADPRQLMQSPCSEMSGRPHRAHLSPTKGRRADEHSAHRGQETPQPGAIGRPQRTQERGRIASRQRSRILVIAIRMRRAREPPALEVN